MAAPTVEIEKSRFQMLVNTLNKLEMAEAKGRMALEDAHQRIEQLEDILSGIKEHAELYAPFNANYQKIVDMCKEGEIDG